VHLSQVKGTEVSEEGLVNQVIIDTEVECVLARLGGILVTDPEQARRNNFDWLVFRGSLSHGLCRTSHDDNKT
jgi:hypothetical protein